MSNFQLFEVTADRWLLPSLSSQKSYNIIQIYLFYKKYKKSIVKKYIIGYDD